MTTPLQQAVTALMEKIDDLGASPMDWPELFAVSKAPEAEQAQAVEPFEIEFPDYHGQAMRYGLEDRNITDRYEAMRYGWDQALERVEDCLPEKLYTHPAPSPAHQVAVLTDIEQYQIQMAGISTAALGYWSEEDEIHPDYDTPALRDVARLYVKYDQLFKEKEARRAHQVAVPMTEAQIFECDQSRTSCLTSSGLILPALSKPITA